VKGTNGNPHLSLARPRFSQSAEVFHLRRLVVAYSDAQALLSGFWFFCHLHAGNYREYIEKGK
jgi:hypothetical protein